jgi:hypothetical protein
MSPITRVHTHGKFHWDCVLAEMVVGVRSGLESHVLAPLHPRATLPARTPAHMSLNQLRKPSPIYIIYFIQLMLLISGHPQVELTIAFKTASIRTLVAWPFHSSSWKAFKAIEQLQQPTSTVVVPPSTLDEWTAGLCEQNAGRVKNSDLFLAPLVDEFNCKHKHKTLLSSIQNLKK